jgi:hypothetical protein
MPVPVVGKVPVAGVKFLQKSLVLSVAAALGVLTVVAHDCGLL